MTKNLRLLFVLLLLICHIMAFGQTRTVTGRVTDNANEPLPGVTILIEGTTSGVITDTFGNYTIDLAPGQDLLKFSFIGFAEQLVNVAGQNQVNVVLSPAVEILDEIVVVGYGTMRKSDISGASVSVAGERLTSTISANLDQALQGKASGLTAVITSGQPGSSVSMRIRGQGTLNANAAEPLYVVDGIQIQNVSQSGGAVGFGDRLGNSPVATFSGLSAINPADILSVEVLKDASATAIFGSRGANGVILITTRRGQAGDARFTYGFSTGVQTQTKKLDLLNLRQFAEFSNSVSAETLGRDPRIEFADPTLLGSGTDWQDAIFRSAPMQSHQVSASGGTENSRYFISGSYFNQDGTVIGSDFQRFTGLVNLDSELRDWWKIGTGINISQSTDNLGLTNSEEGIISIALRSSPDVPIYNTDGSWSGDEREGSGGSINPIAKALDEDLRLKRNNFRANVYSDITFLEGLSLRTELGSDFAYTNAYTFLPTFRHGRIENIINQARRQYSRNLYWELKNFLTYTTSIERHNLTLMAGQEVSEWRNEWMSGLSTGLPSNDIQSPGLGDITTMRVGSGFGSGAMASFYSRATYNFAERYYVNYTFRYDGSSNFGPENRWAPFHAVSAMWRVSNEPFWENLTAVIPNLRLRVGWGQTGNANIGGYRWGAAISRMSTGLGMGYRQSNIANPYVHWEKQEQVNIGVDMDFLNHRINMVVELYDKTSYEMLMEMQLPSYMGTRGNPSARLNAPFGNFGEIQNRGLEISLNTRPLIGQVQWDSDWAISFNENKLLGLTGMPGAAIEGYGQWIDVVSRTEVGQSLFNFYGYVVDGVFTSKDDIINSPRQEGFPETDVAGNLLWGRDGTTWVGDLKFRDISGPEGIPDGIIDAHDRTNIGSPLPKFTFGINNNVRFRAFELNVFITGSYGNKVLNYIGRSISGMNTLWNNQLASVTDRTILGPIDADKPYYDSQGNQIENWFNDIDNVQIVRLGENNMPRAILGDPNDNNRLSDRWLEDGSFLRFRNITLSYNVPQKHTTRLGIDNLRVSINLQNMWTITRYTGLDPEIGASQTSMNVYGLDNGRFPSPRTISLGVNVSF